MCEVQCPKNGACRLGVGKRGLQIHRFPPCFTRSSEQPRISHMGGRWALCLPMPQSYFPAFGLECAYSIRHTLPNFPLACHGTMPQKALLPRYRQIYRVCFTEIIELRGNIFAKARKKCRREFGFKIIIHW